MNDELILDSCGQLAEATARFQMARAVLGTS